MASLFKQFTLAEAGITFSKLSGEDTNIIFYTERYKEDLAYFICYCILFLCSLISNCFNMYGVLIPGSI